MYIFRYNSETGIFTVGSGAAGTYHFSTYLSVFYDEYGVFEIEVNNEAVCTSFGDQSSNTGNDVAQATCSAVVNVNEGNYIGLFVISNFEFFAVFALIQIHLFRNSEFVQIASGFDFWKPKWYGISFLGNFSCDPFYRPQIFLHAYVYRGDICLQRGISLNPPPPPPQPEKQAVHFILEYFLFFQIYFASDKDFI